MVAGHHLDRGDIPFIPPEVSGQDLDREARRSLRGLEPDYADRVARHLVMCARLLDSDPELAYRHARTAADRAGRIDIVRESAGIAAYATGRYAEAARELRTYQRISGTSDYLPAIADCERGLGRPRRAIEIASSPAAKGLEGEAAVEMAIVLAGARADLGEYSAGLAALSRAARIASDEEMAKRVLLARQRIEDLAAGADPESADWMEDDQRPDDSKAHDLEDDVALFDAEEGTW
jgi:hypothetical protein